MWIIDCGDSGHLTIDKINYQQLLTAAEDINATIN